jgi:hypothetical protein
MKFRLFVMLGLIMVVGASASFAGINSKEVGAIVIYPEYYATNSEEPDPNGNYPYDDQFSYITITNDKSTPVNAHMEIIDGDACDDCNFDLPLTGFQTQRLLLARVYVSGVWATVVARSSDIIFGELEDVLPSIIDEVILTACPGRAGFVIATLESPGVEPRVTLGENMLHGDEVVVNLSRGSAVQVGAIAVQGAGPNNGDRIYDFNSVEYKKFPSIVTANFWAPTLGGTVDPRLVLFNVNFNTNDALPPTTNCSINYANADEQIFSRNYSFDCWTDRRLLDIAPGFHELALGTTHGFLWVQCEEGTHGALYTQLNGPATQIWPYPGNADFKDTLFQSTTNANSARLILTPSITGTP